MILTGIIVVLAAALIGVLIFVNNQPPSLIAASRRSPRSNTMEPNSEKWGVNYPNQYSTLLKTETNNTRTTYGGSEPFSKLEEDPRRVTLFAGYGFSKDYNEERGHLNSVTDVEATLTGE